MSIIEQARSELALINFGEEDTAVMIGILETFFRQWDSGGAVWAVAPVLQRLLAGKCLTPLTGADDEWVERDHDDSILQNKRCSSVFKAGELAYDVDASDRHAAITFPYWPEGAVVVSPVLEVHRNLDVDAASERGPGEA